MIKTIIFTLMLISSTFASFTEITSLKPGVAPHELNWLRKLSKETTILALGESGHGVSKYLKARTLMIDTILENKDYSLITIESGYLITNKINKYVQSCKDSLPDQKVLLNILKSMDVTFNNHEFKELIQSVCVHNNENKDHIVNVQGMDIWEFPWDNRDTISKGQIFLKESESEKFKKHFNIAKENCFVWKANNWEDASKLPDYKFFIENLSFDPYKKRTCIAALTRINSMFRKVQSKDFDFHLAKLATKVAMSYEHVIDNRDTNMKEALIKRDLTQAYLTQRWQEYYNTKTILLAHNVHVSKKQSDILTMNPDNQYAWSNVISTGENLIGHYGYQYKSIAISGLNIESSRDGQYPVTDKVNSLDLFLADSYSMGVFSTDSYFLRDKKWWMHLESEQVFLNPKDQYDYVFFIKESKAAETID